ncbi:MAG: MFS transporter [Acidobacteria bacterium]|nr:MFS transporter [Acidobacteriota bacterium]
MNKSRLFVASCISLVTTSMVFAIRGDIEPAMSAAFQLSSQQMGLIWSPAFWAFTIAIFISGALVDVIGMRLLHILSALGYLVGVVLVLVAPYPDGSVASIFETTGTTMLYAGFFIMGLSQGMVEGVINPLVATIHSDEKTKKLTMLHAWWPGGLVIGGLLAYALGSFGVAWQLKLSLILVPAAIYLVMAIAMAYPDTERVTSNISTSDMWREAAKPMFLLLFICMWMTAAVELGPDQWFPSVMSSLTGMQGILFLVYTAGLMFVLRTYFADIAHRSPIGTLVACSILSAAGLYWLGSLQPGASPMVAFAAATLFGVGKTYFWPTMLGITAERFPRGGALLLSVMGGAGMLSVALVLPMMGERIDQRGAGAALQAVSWLGVILAVIFSGLYLYFRANGGYKAVPLSASPRGPQSQ